MIGGNEHDKQRIIDNKFLGLGLCVCTGKRARNSRQLFILDLAGGLVGPIE